jgi:hypothetical protein
MACACLLSQRICHDKGHCDVNTTTPCLCSQLILYSCKGFPPNPFHLWCCTSNTCLEYNQATVNDLRFGVGNLDPLSCYGQYDLTKAAKSTGSNSTQRLTIPIIASACALATLLLFALVVFFRHCRQQRDAVLKEEAMKQQMSNYQQQLEKEKEQSKNEKAELQKMKAQYKMLAMDLLGNTGSGAGAEAKAPPPATMVRSYLVSLLVSRSLSGPAVVFVPPLRGNVSASLGGLQVQCS